MLIPRVCRRLVAFIALTPSLLSAQAERSASSGPGSVTTASAAFAPERLARIDTWLNGLVAEKKIPGAVVLLVRDGRVAYNKAYGVRDMGTNVPERTDDIFRIASQTKAITSLAVMMLWEEGKLSLDDPIEKFIPAFAQQTVMTKFNPADSTFETRPARRKTTIRHLLTHTSGLDYADIGSDEFKAIYAKAGVTASGRPGDVLADRIDVLAKLPLKQEPGERFTYSLSLDVAGRVVEVLSGMPLDQFFRKRIFDPLGMKDTWFELPADKQSRLVTLHQGRRDGTLVPAPQAARKVTYFAGGAGLVSTTADYARFLQLFLNGGELDGVRLLGRKTVELMLTNQVGTLQPAFGLGFQLEVPETDFRSPVSLGTFSWGGAFNTTYWADPKERLVGLIYTNTYGGGTSLGEPFKVLVYSAMK